MRREPPPQLYFVVSAVFHYLGPAFAVLLFARVEVLGVAWLRIASAALVFAVWRRPWRLLDRRDRSGRACSDRASSDGPLDRRDGSRRACSDRASSDRPLAERDRDLRRLLLAWGAVLALMNCCFYLAIDRLPLGTVAAIEFLPVIALAALGARTRRNLVALALAVAGVYLITDVQLAGQPIGVALAFANALLFAAYIVLAHRVAQHGALSGIDGLAASMLIAAVVVTPLGGWEAAPVLLDPVALLAGIGVGLCSSVIPYVSDQLAMTRLPRATYALMVSLLPATATVIGVLVLGQLPTPAEVAGVALVIAGVALHRDASHASEQHPRRGAREHGVDPARAGASSGR